MLSVTSEKPFRLITETGVRNRTDIPLKHYCITNAKCMAMTHNIIFRGFNAVYHHAPRIHPGTEDAADLLLYCKMVYAFVHHHHEVEETTFFPLLAQVTGLPQLMDGNIEQHRQLDEGLERFRLYAERTTPETYDAAVLRTIIEDLAGPLEAHLHEEIPTILDLHRVVDSNTLKKIYGVMHSKAAQVSDKLKTAPYVFGCSDRTFLLDGEAFAFPDVPYFVPYIIDVLIAPWYARAWKFSPFTVYGTPNHKPMELVDSNGTLQSVLLTAVDHMDDQAKRSPLLLTIEIIVVFIALGNLLGVFPAWI